MLKTSKGEGKAGRGRGNRKNTVAQPNEVYLAALLPSAGVEFSAIVMAMEQEKGVVRKGEGVES